MGLGKGIDFITGNNATFDPVPGYNFTLLVEGMYYLPLKSVRAFSKENEYEYIQEGGVNDYVHMKRKPISKPFTFQVERYIDTGVTRFFDPLANGSELTLPCVLFVYRSNASRGWDSEIDADAWAARYFVFTGCVVTNKEYGELNAEKSGLMTETVTIAYRQLMVITNPVDSSTKEDTWTFEKGMDMKDVTKYDPASRYKDGKFTNKMQTLHATQSKNDFNVSGNSGYYINNKQIMDGEGKVLTKSFNIPGDYDAATRRVDGKFNQQFAPVNAKQSKNDIGAPDYKGYTINGKMIADTDGIPTGKVFDMEIANNMSPHHTPVSDNIRTSSRDNEDWTINNKQKRESEEEQFKIPQDYKAEKRRDNGKYSTIYKPKHAVQSPNDMGNDNYKGYIINGKTIIDMKDNIKTSSFDMKDETNISPHKPISDNIATSEQDRANWRINNSQSIGEQFDMQLVNQELPKPMSPNIKTSTADKPLATPVTWPPTRRALMAQALSKK